MTILQDLLNDELKENNIRIKVKEIFEASIDRNINAPLGKNRTAKNAKDINEVYELIGSAIDNYQDRAGVKAPNRVIFTEETPDRVNVPEVITVKLKERVPGSYSQGSPMKGSIKNLQSILREEIDDCENPGYKKATLGYIHDNLITLTVWAQTNKEANRRAIWLENLMDEYQWWFQAEGVLRLIYQGREEDVVVTTKDNKWYGRPLNFFVRTERLRVHSEKTLEEITIKLVSKKQ